MNSSIINPSPRTTRLIVIALLALMAALMFTSVRQESQTFDEADHLYAGFEYWKHADFGRNPEHPPLVKLLAALPLLHMGLKEPPEVPIPFFKAKDFMNGSQFLYSGHNADAILLRARSMAAIFSLILGLLVFLATREMFDNTAALLALGLFVFEPVMLSNGPLITTDMAMTCMFFASVYTFYLYLKRPTMVRLALCGISVGLAITAKHSGALIVPTLLILAITDYFVGLKRSKAEVTADATDTPASNRRLSAGRIFGALAVIAAISYVWLWAIYGFRYNAHPGHLAMVPTLAAYSAPLHPLQRTVIGFFARFHLFPEAYLYGWADILAMSSMRPTFILGHVYPSGRWYFFPAVFLIKSTLTLLVLLLAVPFAKIVGRTRELLFLTIPVVFYLGISIASMLNMGVRHILPMYPFCIVLAGAAAAALLKQSRMSRIAVGALLLLTVVSSLHSFPDFLAYSNEIAGGPSNTWRLITDSNDDWGQGLKWTKTYLDRNSIHDCWFDYSDPLAPATYYGIPCKPLLSDTGMMTGKPSPKISRTVTGPVLISATMLSGIGFGPGELNPYQPFLQRKPDAEIGNVIMVYKGTFDLPLLAAYGQLSMAMGVAQQGHMPEAIALAQTAVQQAPNSALMHVMLGELFMQAGRVAEGQNEFATGRHVAETIEPGFQKPMIDMLMRQISQFMPRAPKPDPKK